MARPLSKLFNANVTWPWPNCTLRCVTRSGRVATFCFQDRDSLLASESQKRCCTVQALPKGCLQRTSHRRSFHERWILHVEALGFPDRRPSAALESATKLRISAGPAEGRALFALGCAVGAIAESW